MDAVELFIVGSRVTEWLRAERKPTKFTENLTVLFKLRLNSMPEMAFVYFAIGVEVRVTNL